MKAAAMPAWLIVLLVVLLLALVLLAGWLLWRRHAAAKADAPAPIPVPELDPASFATALKSLYPAAARLSRYDLPCILVCGDAGADQAALLAAAGLAPVAGNGEYPSGWWKNQDGAAFALPAAAWNADAGPWNDFLDLLDTNRPRRPLDALLWVVPLALLGTNEEVRAAAAARLSSKLVDLQVRLGLQLPVYVVVSDCDSTTGFAQLAAALPAKVREQSLGSANPFALGSALRVKWVEQGMADIIGRLRELVAEVGVHGAAGDAFDLLYQLPENLAGALAPLPDLLNQALRRNATLRSADLRGFYLSGKLPSPARAATDDDELASFRPQQRIAETPEQAAFCSQLFARRIFAEFGLARVAPRALLNERGPRRVVMAASLALSLLWLAMLYPATRDVDRRAKALLAPLAHLRDAIATHGSALAATDAGHDDRNYNEKATATILAEIAALPDWTLSSWAMPLSWTWPLGLDAPLMQVLQTYYDDVVMADISTVLKARRHELPEKNDAADTADAAGARAPARFDALRSFVDDTLEYEENERKFELLAREGLGEWADAA
ncbi:MAG: hypothetical protein JWR07_5685, partial [Nevskia sp.]|nr:hypothetical protein [Nevskia sp.]